MSQIYQNLPPTNGKVVVTTTIGDIDVELWPKEAPLACRNFVQLCLEGYYDNSMFHRIIAKFMVQGGDPTGTGQGGESVWGDTFKDEIHSRLRFGVRGLLAMANGGKDDNGSQFFFTLGQCEWLNGKHTIFGKVTGKTIYNLDAMGDCEVDAEDRPLYPPRILSTEVIHNPFDDIAPRDIKKKVLESKPKVKGKKDKKLLSFADDEEAPGLAEEETGVVKKKMVAAHDVLKDARLEQRTDEARRKDEEEARREACIGDDEGDSADDDDDSSDGEGATGAKKRKDQYIQMKESKLRKLQEQAGQEEEEEDAGEKERAQRKREMEQLKREIMGMKRGGRVKIGSEEASGDAKDVDLLTEHHKKVALLKRSNVLQMCC